MRGFVLGIIFALTATIANAEGPAPEARVALSQNMDFYGSDLKIIFDTTYDACESACLSDTACQAFTFNQRSGSCFPKSEVTQATPFAGAISARVYRLSQAALDQADRRAEDLAFLPDGAIGSARVLAQEIGRLHAPDEATAPFLLTTARTLVAGGQTGQALPYFGAAAAITDAPDLWTEYSRLSRIVSDANPNSAYGPRAVPAAINGYLRAADDAQRIAALTELALGLEAQGMGRDMIRVLRLAQDIQPRRDTDALLVDAIAKYGFRVTETSVEADSATPRICATFSEPLIRAGMDYTPFVQLPDDRLVVEVDEQSLCVVGVEHGTRARIVLRTGLPALSGESLSRPVELTLYVRDRSPSVRFLSTAYVLPRTGDIALPVESVNLPEAEVEVRRMTDRNILRARQDGLLGQPVYEWTKEFLDQYYAQPIWTGTATLSTELNQDVLTRIPLAEALSGQPAGVYIVTAGVPGADPYDTPPASQWFVLSDLGLSTYLGTDGLTVAVRSLGDAAALEGVTVTLLSESNAVLGTVASDAQGVARFAAGLTRGTGSAKPALVIAELGDDLAYLSLTEPAFDLSDRGVEGREPGGPIDVFATTDRGAYRAGETIHLTALARDDHARAIDGLPLTAILYRPDGVEYSRVTSANGIDGGHVFALAVGTTAPRGPWRVAIHADPNAAALVTTTVLVEDFLPERIDFDLTLPPVVGLTEFPQIGIDARFLFGAPAAGLAVEGEALLRAAAGVQGYDGYVFGRRNDPFGAQLNYLVGTTTDGSGQATMTLDLPGVSGISIPLEARVTARVSEGSGRPVERSVTVAVRPDRPMIGIKSLFDDVVPEGGTAAFDLIALTPDLSPTPMAVSWTLNRITTRYQWYSLYGYWSWEPTTRREVVARGTADIQGTAVRVEAPVGWGEYELVVEQTDGDYLASSQTFYAGWYAPAETETTPDVLELSLDAPRYRTGDTATLRIVPRFAGTAVVTVMSNRLIYMETVDVPEGETLIPLTVTDDWGAGAYVSATLIRPADTAKGVGPERALGLGYAQVDPADKALTVTLDTPSEMEPRQPLVTRIHVDGLAEGETAYVTLAAVDVGILNLTAFANPDPQGHYFGQRKLGVELRDLYGRLIDGMNGAMGSVRSGGDAMAGMSMQSPPPTEELVAYFEGPITVGAGGMAEVSFDLPAFNGTLRVMAVAWSRSAVGQASADVLVRDPVVLTASTARFLSPGDQSRVLLEIVHAAGPTGEVGINVQSNGLALASQMIPTRVQLGQSERVVLSLPFAAVESGDQSIDITLTTPDGRALRKTIAVPVRTADPEVVRQSRFTLNAGETFTFDDAVFAGMVSGSGEATVSIGTLARLDAPGLLAALDRYPYGCTEQITAQALPMLYLGDVAREMELASGDQIDLRIAQAITEVLSNQSANGAFGLWYPSSGDLWLDAFVTDFLGRARSLGHTVPDLAFRNAIDNLRNQVNYYPDFDRGGADLAYALLVLAREGAASIGDLRYYADQKQSAFATPLALAQMGAALAAYGDQLRADDLFRAAETMINATTSEDTVWRIDYGTARRDAAGVLALVAEAGSAAVDRDALLARIARGGVARMSTQEATWSLIAASAMTRGLNEAGFEIDGTPASGPLVRMRDAGGAPIRITNRGTSAEDITLTTFGIPVTPEPAGGNGYAIERRYFTLAGDEVDIAEVAAGTRLVTVLRVQPFGYMEGRLMVSDPLPAGFEIDNPNLLQAGEVGALDWLSPVSPQNAEFRSDRFLAAVDWQSDARFDLAYIVRAVTPGRYHHPAASVEDMYRPDRRAQTGSDEVLVTE